MRSTILTAVLALALPACLVGTGDITGGTDPGTQGGGGGGTGGGGGGGGGSGSGSGSGSGTSETPMVTASIDKPTLTPELKSSSQIIITLQASGGFSGAVNLDAVAVDGSGAAISGWTVGLNQQTVTLPTDGMTQVAATLDIPSENMGLTGNVKLTVTPTGLAAQTLMSAVTVTNQVTYTITMNGGQCVYPAGIDQANPDSIKVGTKVVFLNMGTANLIVHSNGGTDGIAHESTGGTGIAPNQTYAQTLTGTGTASFSWYCHSPGPDLNASNPFIKAVP